MEELDTMLAPKDEAEKEAVEALLLTFSSDKVHDSGLLLGLFWLELD